MAKPQGTSRVAHLGQDELLKGRRSGGRPQQRRHPARCHWTPSRSRDLRSDRIAGGVATIEPASRLESKVGAGYSGTRARSA